jgi:hypothetical protein
MLRNILILGSVLAIAGAAQAEPVKVSLQGKSEAAIRADLRKASEQVCQEAATPMDTTHDYNECVFDTYSTAIWKLKQAQAARSDATKVASR